MNEQKLEQIRSYENYVPALLTFGSHRSFVLYHKSCASLSPNPHQHQQSINKTHSQRRDEETIVATTTMLLTHCVIDQRNEASNSSSSSSTIANNNNSVSEEVLRRLSAVRHPPIYDAVKLRYAPIYDRLVTCPPPP